MSQHPGSCVEVTLDKACAIIAADVPRRAIGYLIWHHFYRPSAAQYEGRKTMLGVRRYHKQNKRWRDVGYPWLLAPDGTIFTGRTLKWSGAHCIGRNRDSVGIGMCLNGDVEPLSDFPEMERAVLDISAAICKVHGLTEEGLYFHRDFASKSCPGKLLDRGYYRDRLGVLLYTGPRDEWVRLKMNDQLVPGACLRNIDGTTQVMAQFTWHDEKGDSLVFRPGPVRPQLEEWGYELHWHGDHGKFGTIYSYGPVR